MTVADPPPRAPSRGATVLLLAGIALLALNLRMAVVAVGPLTSRIRADTGLSAAAVSLLTTLPLICFGVFAALAPRLARRIGLERALAVAIATLLAGTALRLIAGSAPLFAGSAVAGAGIAILNVLIAGLIKRDFPQRTGSMMAMYSVLLSGGATLAAGVTVPLGDALHAGWRPSLALWGIPAAVALAVWLPTALRGHTLPETPASPGSGRRVWRTPLAWWVAGYMGSQSLVYYGLTAWLATLLQDHGVSVATSGAMLSVFNFIGIGSGLTMPIVATRMRSQRLLVVFVVVCYGLGLAGLLALGSRGQTWAWACMVLLGLAQGASISLGLTLFVLRTRTATDASELSGMAQTVGYLVAAAGPVTFGALHGLSGSWTPSLIELLAVCGVTLTAGWVAAGPGFLEGAEP